MISDKEFPESGCSTTSKTTASSTKSQDKKNFNWRICARVVKKESMRYWNKGKNSGNLLNIGLADYIDGTQIQTTFYNETAEKYYDFLEEGKVYVFGDGTI